MRIESRAGRVHRGPTPVPLGSRRHPSRPRRRLAEPPAGRRRCRRATRTRRPVGQHLDLPGSTCPSSPSTCRAASPSPTAPDASRPDARPGRARFRWSCLPSPWPAHFMVVGIDDGSGTDGPAAWPAGRYALDLDIEPGGYTRTIGIVVDPAPPTPTLPSPTARPSRRPTEPAPGQRYAGSRVMPYTSPARGSRDRGRRSTGRGRW